MNNTSSEHTEQNQDTRHLVIKLFKRYPKRSLIVFVALVLSGLAEGIGALSLLPLLTLLGESGDAVDNGISQFIENTFSIFNLSLNIETLLGFVFILICIKAAFLLYALRSVGFAMADMAYDIRSRLIRALMSAKWAYFSTLPVGYITNALGTETVRGSRTYLLLCKIMAEITVVFAYLLMACILSPLLTLAAVSLGGFLVFALRRFVSTVKLAGRRQTKHIAALTKLVADSISSLKVIRASNRESHFESFLNKEIDSVRNAKKKQVSGQLILQVVREPLSVLLVTIGIYCVYTYTDMSIASMITLAFMFLRIMQKVTGVQVLYQNLVADESAFWAVNNAIESAEAMQEKMLGEKSKSLEKAIHFKNVDYTHSSDDQAHKVLENISASFPVNKFTAIIGPSGSGKTTLVDLIIGLYPPQNGEILVDDANLADIDINSWRQSIGYVSQDSTLLNESVYNNITMGKDDIDEEQVNKALERAGILNFVQELPDGLNEIVGERGLKFSGGQRQRIAIARALVTNPTLLILDEATSALDKNTAREFLESVKSLSTSMTVIAISHDKEILDYADQAYNVQDGSITEVK